MIESGGSMGETVRFGVSMDSELVDLLDKLTTAEGHENRSETIRSLVRKEITETGSTDAEHEVIGTVTLLYHYQTRIPRVLINDYPSVRINSNIQLHAEDEICIKVIVVKGKGAEVQAWARKLLSSKKIIGKLSITATEDLYRELI